MGTNFFSKKHVKKCQRHSGHLGKRSAAGPYCWDCEISLCKDGDKRVHYSGGWLSSCPKCGKEPEKESISDGSIGRELGFNKSKPKKKDGVKSCSSFNWSKDPIFLETLSDKGKPIVDEYGRSYSMKEFRSILDECPIRFYDMVGEEFS